MEAVRALDPEACKSAVVDLVNPKFKNYSKPFLLAALVGTSTAFFTFGLFLAVYESPCSTEDENWTDQELTYLYKRMAVGEPWNANGKPWVDCYYWFYRARLRCFAHWRPQSSSGYNGSAQPRRRETERPPDQS